MTYYHVRITQKLNGAKDETKLDLTLEELENQIVRPYKHGQTITINGRTILTKTIERIKISNSSAKSDYLQPNVIQNPKAAAFATTGSIRRYIVDSSEDVTDKFITGPPEFGVEASHTVKKQPNSTTSMRVFISHSSNDIRVAELLIDLLRKALNLKSEEIRCTSVDGYGMPGGASVDETLRVEVHDAELLIGIVTPASLKSAYVMFELGARWGAGKRMIPLLASGATPNHLGGPLAGLNALDASQIGQLHQLLEEAAQHLSVDLEKASSYAATVEELAKEAAKAADYLEEQSTGAAGYVQLSEDAKELLNEATRDRAGFIMAVGGIIQTNEKQFGERRNPRSQAKWKAALEELFDQILIEDPSGKSEVFKVTNMGYQVADELANEG